MASVEELTKLAVDLSGIKARADVAGLRQVVYSLDVAYNDLIVAVREVMEKEVEAVSEAAEEVEG